MKSYIKKTAQKMYGFPVVGRLLQIAAAVIRLPELRRDYLARINLINDFGARQQQFEAQQLPTILQGIADVNHRQIVSVSDNNNLVKSVPVVVRKLTRDIHALQQEMTGANGRLNNNASSLEYLFGRVEFVRRELMFEMRYGASSVMDKKKSFETETQIISREKVEDAKVSGIRLNLGCGHVPLDGYLNVDRRALPGVDIVAEIDALPFEKNQVAEISSAHMLEHFPQEELRRNLLPYWFSLLKSGGKFRAIVPDAEGMIQAYHSNEYTFDRLREVTFGGQDYDGDFHYNMMTTESLRTLLEEAGFSGFTVLAKNRENGGCKEFEIVASRLDGGV